VAGYSFGVSDGSSHALVWTDGKPQDLGTLGGRSAGAADINDGGQVVGSSRLADDTSHAFLYSEGRMFDLNQSIPASSGWQLISARTINDAGQIGGVGMHNGKQEAYLFEPQTVLGPLTAQVAISGSASALVRRRVSAAAASTTQTIVQGGTVQWQNAGPVGPVGDASGMGLFGSPPLNLGGGYAFRFDAAGSYAYATSGSPAKRTVNVPMESAPAKGKVKTVFQIYWCFCHAPKGYVFDAQIKSPHTKSFRRFQTGTTKGLTAAKPGHGKGSYQFRARIRKRKGGKASGWSPVMRVQVR
jgi:probable HAF family extracellular repeat protein